MKKTILFLVPFILFLNYSQLKAQNYSTGFDTPAEQAGWIEFRTGSTEPFYHWIVSTFGGLSAPNSILHNYPVGGSIATDDWFVSPAFDFTNGGKIDSVWHSFAGFGLPQIADTVAIYLLNGSNDPGLALSKTMLHEYRDTNYTADNTWTLDTNILIPAQTGQSYIAFRYKTVVNWLDVKFDDLSITINGTIGIPQAQLKNSSISIYPNPTANVALIDAADDMVINTISLFSNMGQEVGHFDGSEKVINMEGLPSGLYILRMTSNHGIITRQIIKD